MKKRDFVSIADFSPGTLKRVLDAASEMKGRPARRLLEGKSLGLLFQKPSLRTRVSLDVAMTQLGGHVIYLSPEEVGLGVRETAEDAARVLSRYLDAIAARTFTHEDVETLARFATVPVINALSDAEHPCQAMADLLTIKEKTGGLEGRTIAFIGDGNNVAASLALSAAAVGACFRIASPAGFELPERVTRRVRALGRGNGVGFDQLRDPQAAARGADVVYTDVWTSMGQEDERQRRRAAFAGYQVTPQMLDMAKPGAVFMHPLPAHHGEEIAPGLLEHPASVVFDQAENRLHVQKAILLQVLAAPACE